MDNGYRMLVHVVQQVFGNLAQAARVTLLLTLLPSLIALFAMGDLYGQMEMLRNASNDPTQLPDIPEGFFLNLIVIAVLSMITYCWAAVGWHRYILLEEIGAGPLPQWRGGRVASYIGRAFLLVLVLVLISLVGGFVVGFVALLLPVPLFAAVLFTGLAVGLMWVLTRLGLILPAAALGQPMSLGESWEATRPVSTDLLLPLIVITIAGGGLAQLNLSVLGSGPVGTILGMLIYWLQVLMNLSLMTTLYGTQVEGRRLN